MRRNGTNRVPYKKQLTAVGNGLAPFRVQIVGWVHVPAKQGMASLNVYKSKLNQSQPTDNLSTSPAMADDELERDTLSASLPGEGCVPLDRLPDVGRIAFHLPLRVGNRVQSGSPPTSALPKKRRPFQIAHRKKT